MSAQARRSCKRWTGKKGERRLFLKTENEESCAGWVMLEPEPLRWEKAIKGEKGTRSQAEKAIAKRVFQEGKQL